MSYAQNKLFYCAENLNNFNKFKQLKIKISYVVAPQLMSHACLLIVCVCIRFGTCGCVSCLCVYVDKHMTSYFLTV
jgi:hypothetical protein